MIERFLNLSIIQFFNLSIKNENNSTNGRSRLSFKTTFFNRT